MRALLFAVASACVAALPRGWGVNIHFTDGRPGEARQVAEAFTIARVDFYWGTVEAVRGVYNFSAYERLLADLKAHKAGCAASM
jgi:hypothetical protein